MFVLTVAPVLVDDTVPRLGGWSAAAATTVSRPGNRVIAMHTWWASLVPTSPPAALAAPMAAAVAPVVARVVLVTFTADGRVVAYVLAGGIVEAGPVLVTAGVTGVWAVPAAVVDSLRRPTPVPTEVACPRPVLVTTGRDGVQLWFERPGSATGLDLVAETVCPPNVDISPFALDIAAFSLVAQRPSAHQSTEDNAVAGDATKAGDSWWAHRRALHLQNQSPTRAARPARNVQHVHRLQTTTVPLLPALLRYWLTVGAAAAALDAVVAWQHVDTLPGHLELLLASVVDDDKRVMPAVPVAAIASADRLSVVLAFLQQLRCYPHTLVQCMRKTDASRWHRFFPAAGDPLALVSHCLHAGHVATAAAYLLIVERMHGPLVTRLLAVRILRDALAAERYRLVYNVHRFLASSNAKATADETRIQASVDRVMTDGAARWARARQFATDAAGLKKAFHDFLESSADVS